MKEPLSRQDRRDLLRRFLPLCVLAFLIAALSAVFSLGWFSVNTTAVASGQRVSLAKSAYELAVSGDQATPFADDHDLVLYLEQAEQGGYEKLASTSGGHPSILCHMTNENPHEPGSEEIAPGTFGVISFDIVVPAGSGYSSFVIDLDFIPVADNGAGPTAVAAEDEDELLDLLQGHVFFFRERSALQNGGRYYTGRLDGSVTVSLDGLPHVTRADGVHYTVEFYWIWPATYAQIVFDSGDGRVRMHALFDTDAGGAAERADTLDLIQGHPERFFRGLGPAVDLTRADFDNYYYLELSEGYNRGDQFLGDRIRYLAVKMTVTPE